jgi:flagellar P-ring protein precursor FlgI
MNFFRFFLITSLIFAIHISSSSAEVSVRIKDIAKVAGVANNQLIGYGLVVGLAGTGDSTRTIMTAQSISNMLNKFGIGLTKEQMNSKNVAAVIVTADLPPFTRNGDNIDVTASSLGDATSIQGGVLLFTPLSGADGNVYGSAQGPVSIGGFNATGGGGNKITKNHPVVGRIPDGGLINQDFSTTVTRGNEILLSLNEADFTTAQRMAEVINMTFSPETAKALDPGTIRIYVPAEYQEHTVEFMSRIEELTLVPDELAKIIINERTGTVVINKDIKISPVAVSHGNITVIIKVTPSVSQPPPLSSGTTQTVDNTAIQVKEEKKNLIYLSESTSLQQVVDALNAIGATPRDLIAILQALKEAGALQGTLDII